FSFIFVFFLLRRPHPSPTLFPYTTLFRSYRHPGRDRPARADPGQYGPSLSASPRGQGAGGISVGRAARGAGEDEGRPALPGTGRSEEHTSELQSHLNLVCRLLLEKKKKNK